MISSISTSAPLGPNDTGKDVIVVDQAVEVVEHSVEIWVDSSAFNLPANVCLTVR